MTERARHLGRLSSLTPNRGTRKMGRCTGLVWCVIPLHKCIGMHLSARGVLMNLGTWGLGEWSSPCWHWTDLSVMFVITGLRLGGFACTLLRIGLCCLVVFGCATYNEIRGNCCNY